MKEANYAPVYCALYPGMARIARKHGYALAIHGSLANDLDLICVPWVTSPSEPILVVNEITKRFHIQDRFEDPKPHPKEHGREAWTLHIGHGVCRVDLSFMPSRPHDPPPDCETCHRARFIRNPALGPVWINCPTCTPANTEEP